MVAGGEVGFGDDFEEGCAGSVEIDDGEVDGVSAGGFVEEFAGVFLEVGPADADGFDRAVLEGEVEDALGAEWEVVLADLVVFREIGIEVAFAVPLGVFGDFAAEGEADEDGVFDGFFVHDGEYAGQAEDLFVDEGVGVCAEGVGGGGEHFAGGGELDVDFHADEDFVGFYLALRQFELLSRSGKYKGI